MLLFITIINFHNYMLVLFNMFMFLIFNALVYENLEVMNSDKSKESLAYGISLENLMWIISTLARGVCVGHINTTLF